MDWRQKAVRIIGALLACMFAVQMMKFLIQPIVKILSNPNAASLLIYLETGRVVKPTLPETVPPETEETVPPQTLPE